MKRAWIILIVALLAVAILWTNSRWEADLELAEGPTNKSLPKSISGRRSISARRSLQSELSDGFTVQSNSVVAEQTNYLSREKIETYLARYGTNVENLVAAFQLSSDRDYLRMAATNFPNDPMLQHFAATLDLFPGQKREWLDRFKQNAPDNALASYLSAADHLKNGNRELALKDFESASNLPKLTDYSLEMAQGAEDMLMASGKPVLEAKWVGMSTTLLPALAPLKGLSQGMADIYQEFLSEGNMEMANTLAEMNYRLGQRHSSEGGGRFLIHQLVGYAMERITLSRLDPNGSYDFLPGTTPGQRIEQLQSERTRVKELTRDMPNDYYSPGADGVEWLGYFDRVKAFGERNALEWLKKRRGAAPNQPGPQP